MDDPLQATDCAVRLKALADPDRLRIVQCLRGGPRSVGELSRLVAEDLANVSHHLGVLRRAGLVSDAKAGKYVIYSLHPEVYRPGCDAAQDVLDLGCCKLELTGKSSESAE
jgi:ArsR family transcriptional regulator